MHEVRCNNGACTAVATVEGATDVHSALDAAGCGCCGQDHHHGQAAASSGVPCRPVTITMIPGSVPANPAE